MYIVCMYDPLGHLGENIDAFFVNRLRDNHHHFRTIWPMRRSTSKQAVYYIHPAKPNRQQLFLLCNGLHVGNLFNNTLGSKFCSNLLWKGEEGQGEKRIDYSFHNGGSLCTEYNISYACTQFTTQCSICTYLNFPMDWCSLNLRLVSLCNVNL